MEITIAQINPIVGDFEYNLNLIKKIWLSADKKSDIYPSRMKKMARRTTALDRKPILNRCEPEIRQCNNARASFLMGIILFPELCVCGYNPQDLALRAEFIEDCENSVKSLVEYSKNLESAAIIGSISRKEGKIYNSAFLIYQGQILHTHNKIALPNYGVFDDKRIFSAGDEIKAFEFNGQKIAIVICEDIWEDELYTGFKSEDIYPSRMKKMARQTTVEHRNVPLVLEERRSRKFNNASRSLLMGIDYLFVLNASPFTKTKKQQRLTVAKRRAEELSSYVIYANQVGLQDSVLYDGSSFMMDKNGDIILQMESFEEGLEACDLDVIASRPGQRPAIAWQSSTIFCESNEHKIIKSKQSSQNISPGSSTSLAPQDDIDPQEIYQALVFALRDYTNKHSIKEIVIGFSSGIDSTLTSIIAFDALGKDKVNLIAMPSKYNSLETISDAEKFAIINNVDFKTISIESLFEEFIGALSFDKNDDSIASQNLQSRIRGVILMAYANKHNYLLLTTGNKSELATGYATLYGDMNGGYNLLKDLYKSEVYNLAEWRNAHLPKDSLHAINSPIPTNIITKEPSAELAFNQRDSDSLPPYDILDRILFNYIDLSMSKKDIIALGFNAEVVDQVVNLVRISQFKRYQSVMGPKISDMSFDLDWRYPITNRYK